MTEISPITVNSSLYKVLLEPTKVFNYLNEHPNILRPFILFLITGMMITVGLYPFIYDGVIEIFELKESMSLSIVSFVVLTVFICSAIIIEWMLLAIFIYFLSILLTKQVLNFRKVFSITGHSFVPLIIKYLGFTVLIVIKGQMFEPQGFSVLFPNLKNPVIIGFLKNIDLIAIWQMTILLIGVKVLTADKHWIKPALIVITPFIFSMVLRLTPLFFAEAILN